MNTLSMVKKVLNKTNNRGISLIYVTLLLIALLAFVGLAIDIGYMYVTKTELQNAADSAALAGVSLMKYVGPGGADPNDTTQSLARSEAIAFAAKNKATKIDIAIENDNSNTLNDDNDITIGQWKTAFSPLSSSSYSPNTTPVNAIQVRARRTEQSPGLPVELFLGRVFGWDKMGVSADAIAALPVRATSFIAMCTRICSGVSTDPANPTQFNPPRFLERNPTAPYESQFAWTSLLVQTTSTTDITALVCSENPNEQVCGKRIYTSQGTSGAGFKDLEAVFNDPNFDRGNKEFLGSQVTAWWVMVPITEDCPVTSQGLGNGTEPKIVSMYALIRIRSACDQGGGKGSLCRNYQTSNCNNLNIDGTRYDCTQKIVIDRIACIDCRDISKRAGLKAVLVE